MWEGKPGYRTEGGEGGQTMKENEMGERHTHRQTDWLPGDLYSETGGWLGEEPLTNTEK